MEVAHLFINYSPWPRWVGDMVYPLCMRAFLTSPRAEKLEPGRQPPEAYLGSLILPAKNKKQSQIN